MSGCGASSHRVEQISRRRKRARRAPVRCRLGQRDQRGRRVAAAPSGGDGPGPGIATAGDFTVLRLGLDYGGGTARFERQKGSSDVVRPALQLLARHGAGRTSRALRTRLAAVAPVGAGSTGDCLHGWEEGLTAAAFSRRPWPSGFLTGADRPLDGSMNEPLRRLAPTAWDRRA